MYDNVMACHLAEQSSTAPFTDFANVTKATNLATLNLNWREQDLPERERTKHVHRLHPYMGKFIPQLVELFLKKYEPDLVYDPFCGSGTTLVEAKASGVNSIGVDISEFNVLLSRVKTVSYNIEQLTDNANDALEYIHNRENPNLLSLNTESTSGLLDNDYLNMWFAEKALEDLLNYQAFTEKLDYADLFSIIVSRAARSARRTKHFDLDFPKSPQLTPYHCYKHNKICNPVGEANKFLRRYTLDAVRRLTQFDALSPTGKATVIHGDSRTVDLPFDIDMVFTSPPYIGMIDYHEQHRYAYELLGLENNEDKEIGSAKKGVSNRAKQNYINSINDVFCRTREHMVDRGIMCIVVNDKYNLYRPELIGFRSIGNIKRLVNRRTGRRAGAFFESILIWEKI